MSHLEKLRSDIDEIDKELTALFEKRMNIVLEIAKLKEESHSPILDKSREEKIISKNSSYLNDKKYKEELALFFNSILDISKSIQAKRR